MIDTDVFIPRNYNRFFDDIDRLREATSAFFGTLLLSRISDIFGYDSISLTHYPNRQYVGVESIGTASEVIGYYDSVFRPNDPFAHYISRNFNPNSGIEIFQSSKIFTDDYQGCVYNKFLKQFGVHWALTAAFDDYRITLYKGESEGDFLPIEIDSLALIANIIKGRANKYKAERSPALLSKNLAVPLANDEDFNKSIKANYPLSNQEARIAILLASGMSYKEIGAATYTSINTVRSHVKNIYRKLGVNSFFALHELIWPV
jgi:DNA-binding CsgD family transcriptional regulator